jgi:SAM-dependent methyltransferase
LNRHGNQQKHLNPNPLQRFLLQRFHHKIIGLIGQTGVTCLLDAGCGEGFVLNHIRQALPVTMIGGDADLPSLLWGRANVGHGQPVTNLDIQRLPFPDDSFPLVICLEVLEHLPDSRVGLVELARVSADYLLLSVPHEPYFRGANFIRGRHLRAFGNDPEHLHNYSGQSFRQMLSGVVDLVWHGYSFPWQIALARKRKR